MERPMIKLILLLFYLSSFSVISLYLFMIISNHLKYDSVSKTTIQMPNKAPSLTSNICFHISEMIKPGALDNYYKQNNISEVNQGNGGIYSIPFTRKELFSLTPNWGNFKLRDDDYGGVQWISGHDRYITIQPFAHSCYVVNGYEMIYGVGLKIPREGVGVNFFLSMWNNTPNAEIALSSRYQDTVSNWTCLHAEGYFLEHHQAPKPYSDCTKYGSTDNLASSYYDCVEKCRRRISMAESKYDHPPDVMYELMNHHENETPFYLGVHRSHHDCKRLCSDNECDYLTVITHNRKETCPDDRYYAHRTKPVAYFLLDKPRTPSLKVTTSPKMLLIELAGFASAPFVFLLTFLVVQLEHCSSKNTNVNQVESVKHVTCSHANTQLVEQSEFQEFKQEYDQLTEKLISALERLESKN